MAAEKVIVFGPTGAVGSSAALTAASLGAHVTLAMRDPSKPIPGLSSTAETSGAYTRIQADLSQPSTVAAAVKQSGAKHAFIYLVFGSPDHMKSTIQALKDAGITLVVFLSSFSVQPDIPLESITPDAVIPYLHAQVEINLTSIFGEDGYIAIRPASFASNELMYREGFQQGEVKISYPGNRLDGIVPKDIGRVSGHVLAKGVPSDGNRRIYLYGPQIITRRESVATIAKVLGKEPKVVEASEEEAKAMMGAKYPPSLVEYFVRTSRHAAEQGPGHIAGEPVRESDMGNVEKYGGGVKAMTFEQWVRENKDMFLS